MMYIHRYHIIYITRYETSIRIHTNFEAVAVMVAQYIYINEVDIIQGKVFNSFYCRTKRSENLRFSEENGLM